MRLVLGLGLCFIPGVISLGVASWLAQFRTGAGVKEDSGVGNYLAAHRARNTLANYTPEGRRWLPLLWLTQALQAICLVAAIVLLAWQAP
jgi:hypothetical protein